MLADKYFRLLISAVENAPLESIERSILVINETVNAGRNIFVCGNGGSAQTASHFVTDWSKMRWVNKRKQFKAYCLSDNIGMLSAYGNDLTFSDIFCEPLQNYASEGDLLIVISGSGNSENVIRALKTAKDMGLRTIGLSGFSGGLVKKIAEISVHFPVNDMQIVEDLHLSFGHIVMKQICL